MEDIQVFDNIGEMSLDDADQLSDTYNMKKDEIPALSINQSNSEDDDVSKASLADLNKLMQSNQFGKVCEHLQRQQSWEDLTKCCELISKQNSSLLQVQTKHLANTAIRFAELEQKDVRGDGNCLFNSVAFATEGKQDPIAAQRLRLGAIVTGCIHEDTLLQSFKDKYSPSIENFLHTITTGDVLEACSNSSNKLEAVYRKEVRRTLGDGSYSGLLQVYLLSSHLGCPIQQYCDELGYDHYITLVEPVFGNLTAGTIHLKWVKADGSSVPNHVVLLLPKETGDEGHSKQRSKAKTQHVYRVDVDLAGKKENKANRKKIIKRVCALLQEPEGGKIILCNKNPNKASIRNLDALWQSLEKDLTKLTDSAMYSDFFNRVGKHDDKEIHLNVLRRYGCCTVKFNAFIRRDKSSVEPTRSDALKMLENGRDNNFCPTINPELKHLQVPQQELLNYGDKVEFDECTTIEYKLWRGDKRAFLSYIESEDFERKIDEVRERGGHFVAGTCDGIVKGIYCPETFRDDAEKKLKKLVEKQRNVSKIKFWPVKGVPVEEELYVVVIGIYRDETKKEKDEQNVQSFRDLKYGSKVDTAKLEPAGFKLLPAPTELTLFKHHTQRDELTKAVSGFANARGGRLLIGIDDTSGIIKGQKDDTNPSVDSSVRKDIEYWIRKHINSMTWGLQQSHQKDRLGFEPQKGIHWELDFLKVNTGANIVYPLAIVEISVAGIQNSGGVFVATPESYVTKDKNPMEPRPLTSIEWKNRMIREIDGRTPGHQSEPPPDTHVAVTGPSDVRVYARSGSIQEEGQGELDASEQSGGNSDPVIEELERKIV